MIASPTDGVKRSAPTMEDVAKKAGVSRALVSLVFRDAPHVSEDRRQRVLEAAAALNYRPNAAARSLASHATKTIGVMLQDLHDSYFAEVFEGIAAEADVLGYRLLIGTGGRQAQGEAQTLESFLEYRVDGVILVSTMMTNDELIRFSKQVPTVVTGHYIRVPTIDTVNSDNQLGAELVVNHLYELGHRTIVHIDGGDEFSALPRREAYEQTMLELGLRPQSIRGGYTEQGGVAAAEEIIAMSTRPSAIFAFNDRVAIGAMDRLEQHGLKIPEDLTIVGYDNTLISALTPISLTTINQPRDEMGRLTVRTVVNRITSRRQTAVRHTLQPTLIVRHTSQAVTPPPRRGASKKSR